MKILFIVPYPTSGPSNRFRVEQYLPYLEKERIEFSLRPFLNERFYFLLREKGHFLEKGLLLCGSILSRLADVFRSSSFDAVFIHREASPFKDCFFEILFKIFSKKIIFDFDDAVFLKKPLKVKYLLKTADHVIAGNKFLADFALTFNKNVSVLATCVDTDKYSPSVKDVIKDKVVVGWIGTPSTSVYLKGLIGVFSALKEKHRDVEVRVVGGMSEDFLEDAVTYRDWSLESEITELRDFDIGIMPMPDNEWTKGKCAFKLIQYMALGIPAVVSPVGMNKEVVVEGPCGNGFFASTQAQWLDKLSALVCDHKLRKDNGVRGRRIAEEKYSAAFAAPKFIRILKDAAGGIDKQNR